MIGIFSDIGDVVIDPCAGSASTLRAAFEMRRDAYGFEIDKKFYREAKEKMLVTDVLNTIRTLHSGLEQTLFGIGELNEINYQISRLEMVDCIVDNSALPRAPQLS